MTCRHCECEATDHDLSEGDTFRCETCGVLGTVYQGDRDVGDVAVAYLYFKPNDGELCSVGACEE